MTRPQHVAVIGAGIAGLSAARELRRRGHRVEIFEASKRPGGHTCTVEVDDPATGRQLAVDMGFIVYNERTYPNFCVLLDELGVATEESSMSFSVRCEKTGLEYCGSSLRQLFVQKRNLLSPSFYRMLAGIARFNRRAAADLLEADPKLSLGEYLEREGFRGPFVDHYLLPMSSAIWSTPPGRMLDFPARSLARFLHNHGMIQIRDRPVWRVVTGGSRRYVDALVEPFGENLHLGAKIELIRRHRDAVELRTGGRSLFFDAMVVATHSDTALRLLADPSPAERQILGALPYRDNEVVLHRDTSFLPRHQAAWSSWNYHLPKEPAGSTQLTYSMNILQNLPTSTQYLVTLNRSAEIDPRLVLHQASMAHPQFTTAGLLAQERWDELSRGRTFYAGAYWFYGFHEDGAKSGLRAAAALDAAAPRLAAESRRLAELRLAGPSLAEPVLAGGPA
jgi:predicted NAD/FAD-binding protein